MEVYNYFRTQWADVDTPVDDAPPKIARAIEAWLERQVLGEGVGIRIGELDDPGLTLLALHAEGATPGSELVHVVAVPDHHLEGAPAKPLTELFTALYGGRPEVEAPRLQRELARHRHTGGAAQALRRFASPADVAGLSWSPNAGGVPSLVATRAARPIRVLASRRALLAVGFAAACLGLAIAALPRIEALLARDRPASVEGELRDRIARLEGRIDALTRELHDEAADRRLALARVERRYAQAQAPSPRLAEPLPSLEIVGEPIAPLPTSVAVAEPEPEPSAPDPLPRVAAPPPEAPAPVQLDFRIAARTARVRAGPSGRAATRGLLPRGEHVVARAEMGEWIEIEPPPDFAEPSWIHVSLVETSEDLAN